ncbi:MAG TPA: hypothetical protein VF519_15940 [Mycobacteriales bacterium]|jgi:hypothetical protein
MLRTLAAAALVAGLAATAGPAAARPVWRTCEDWEDVFCYSPRHEMFCQAYVAERCVNLPKLDEPIN